MTADLADETILRFPPGWGVRATFDAVLGADPSAIEIADYALMLTLVRGRFGTTLLPASAITLGRPAPEQLLILNWQVRFREEEGGAGRVRAGV